MVIFISSHRLTGFCDVCPDSLTHQWDMGASLASHQAYICLCPQKRVIRVGRVRVTLRRISWLPGLVIGSFALSVKEVCPGLWAALC